jgi:hypothetical protein
LVKKRGQSFFLYHSKSIFTINLQKHPMKKLKLALCATLLALCGAAFGQSAPHERFAPGGTTAGSLSLTQLAGKDHIQAAFLNGKMGDADALGLQLTNDADQPVSFSWTIKDKNGNVVLRSETTTLAAGQRISAVTQDNLSFVVTDGQKAGDFTIDITTK